MTTPFETLLDQFTAAVIAGNGHDLAALFTENGSYHDTFYGKFTGRTAIEAMLEQYFHRDGTDFMWEMRHPLQSGLLGYASWTFSYSGNTDATAGKRVVVEGMSCFHMDADSSTLHIAQYDEVFNGAIALAQLGFEPQRIVKLLDKWGKTTTQSVENSTHLRSL